MTDPRKKLSAPGQRPISGGHAGQRPAPGAHPRAGAPSPPHARPAAFMAAGKGKSPVPPRRPGTVPAKPAPKPDTKPAKAPMKPIAKTGAKPTPKPAAKPAAKPAPQKPPAALNKGAAAAKALAEKRAAERAEAAAKRAPKLVPATPNAVRPGASKAAPAKGKAAPKPAPEVRPLGVLPPEAMAKAKPAPTHSRVVIPEPRPVRAAGTPSGHASRPGAAPSGTRTPTRGDDRLSDQDLKHFETRLLEERARIMSEMGHFENTLLKVNPRDSSGDVGGYSFHMADAGTDSMEREISFDIASKEGRLMREIDDALRRIYNGVYGICEASGQPIPRARLEALPWARYTIQEQENIEKKQRAGRLTKEEE